MQSKHPNHLWQLDPSLCVLYYLRPSPNEANGLQVMDQSEFYKNKPKNLARIENERVWRYVITDHASGAIYAEYVLGAESGANLAHVFINAIQQREHQPFHGVPLLLMMDPGSANTSGLFGNLADALRIDLQINRPKNPRAKGQVEQANNLIETKFESGLRFVGARDLGELNRLLWKWLAWYNGSQTHTRHGMTRFEAWQTITAEQLRLAPDVATCRSLLHTRPIDRQVKPELTVPWEGADYDVSHIPGVNVGEKLWISTNPYRPEQIQIHDHDEAGNKVFHVADKVVNGLLGMPADGPVVGEEYKATPKTRHERHAEQAAMLAAGVGTLDELEQYRKAKARKGAQVAPAFGGKINPYQRADNYTPPDWLPKRGQAPDLAAPRIEARPLSHIEAAKALKKRLGEGWTAGHFARLQGEFPDGVPEGELERIALRYGNAAGLRSVGG